VSQSEPTRPGTPTGPDDDPAVRLSDLWRQGKRPDVREFLRHAGNLTPAQLVAVLCVDQWERWHAGERVFAETHLGMHPALQTAEEAFDLVYGEYLLREEAGETPKPEEYLARFPQYTANLQRQFELHRAIESGFIPKEGSVLASTGDSVAIPEAVPPAAKKQAVEREIPTIPGYDILGEIGRGGMGRVYKAVQQRLNRTVALKVIHKERVSQNAEAVRRFQREAQAAAQLSHPNVVIVYDTDQVGDVYFIAMEYVEGIDLHELIKDGGPLAIEQASDYIRQAALGLQHAYERGLVHRDIKPSNLLVTMPRKPGQRQPGFQLLPALPDKNKPEAEKPDKPGANKPKKPIRPLGLSYMGTCPVGIVKILDMGLALVTHGPDSESANWTQEGTLMGTPDFIAPEQAINSHMVDIRADLYSLGCTFYYLLAGQPPFGEHPLIKKLMMHQVADPKPIEELRPEVPIPIRTILKKLLAKRPEDRYQTPAELAYALAAFKASLSGKALPPPPGVAAPAPPVGQDFLPSDAPPTWRPTGKSAPQPPAAAPPPPIASPNRQTSPLISRKTEANLALPSAKPAKREEPLPPGVSKAQKIAVLEGHRGHVIAVAFSPDRSTLASGGVDGGIRLWDLAGTEPRDNAIPNAHASDVSCLAFALNSKLLASGTGSLDGDVRVWDYSGEHPQPIANMPVKHSTVDALAFSLDHRLLAFGGSDRLIHVWDLSGLNPVDKGVLKGHSDSVKALAFPSDNQMLVSSGPDGALRFWNLTRYWSKEQAVIQGNWGQVKTIAFSPDYTQIAFGCLDQTVRLWDLSTPNPSECRAFVGHLGGVRVLQFNPDGKKITSVCDGGRVILWDIAAGKKEKEWWLPRTRVFGSVALTHDARYLATGNSDGSVVLFRLYPRRQQPS
jgi:serine/threonine protein kinase